ncbi:MAG: hypothetical protein M3547_01365 [Acidobacteriota bacterium]|nr:hypothetical protein [Acidobacteriota bacterium]
MSFENLGNVIAALGRLRIPEFDEAAFQRWYQAIALANGLNANPDAPEHFYDYRGAYRAGATPDESGHWPSQFKQEGHPRTYLAIGPNGEMVDTRTGELVEKIHGQLGLISTRLAGISEAAAAVRTLPLFRPGDNREEPSSSRNVQDLSRLTPEAQAAALRGGVGPGMSTGSGWAAFGPEERNRPGFNPPAGSGRIDPAIYIPADYSEGARQRREQRAGGWNDAAAAQVIEQIRALIARLEQVFGGPTYAGQILEQEIRNLEAKVLTPDEALAFVRYVLGTMSAGLQQEALSPVASIRNIANDLLRFAGGAALPGGQGALTPGQRANPPAGAGAAQGESVAAGIGGAIAGAVREGVAALGVTVTRSAEQQTERVLAGVRSQTAAAERNQRTIAEWQRSVEGTYLRPLRENMFSPRELIDRFQALLATRRVG